MQPSATAPGGARFPGIDVTRAVAALAVLTSHLVQTLTWRIPGWEATAGAVARPVHVFTGTTGAWGVGLFLVVSGFCIHLPMARRLGEEPGARLDTGAYLRRRLTRIYPPYLGALLLSAAVAWAMPPALVRSTLLGVPTLEQLGSHLLLVHAAFPSHHSAINAVLWTIALEAQFYVLYPLLLALRRRVGAPWLCAILLGTAVISRLAAVALLPAPYARLLNDSLLRRGWEFGLGMWVAERVSASPRSWRSGRLAFAGLAIATLLGGLALAALPGGMRLRALAWPVLFAVAVEAAARWGPGSAVPERMGRWLGERSYSLYLVHPIGLALGLWLAPGWPTARGSATVLMLACTALVLVAFFELVERRVTVRRMA